MFQFEYKTRITFRQRKIRFICVSTRRSQENGHTYCGCNEYGK